MATRRLAERRARGARRLRRVRRQPARPDQPRPRRPRARAPARTPLCAPPGRARARQGRAPAPAGAQLRGAGRGRRRGADPRPRAGDDRDAAARPRPAGRSHEHASRHSARPGRPGGRPRPVPGHASAQGEPDRAPADRRAARGRPPLVGDRRRNRAGAGAALHARRRRPPDRLERHGPHRRAARARQRGRAGGRDVAAARYLGVDDVRHGRPAEVGRRRGRLARDRPLRRPPRQPARTRHVRRPRPRHLAGPAGRPRPARAPDRTPARARPRAGRADLAGCGPRRGSAGWPDAVP